MVTMLLYKPMKQIIRSMLLGVGSLLMMLLAGCHEYNVPQRQQVERRANISLRDFCQMVGERTIVIAEEVVAGGYVISSDEESNFFKSLVIDDGTGAIEIMVGLYDSFNIYPLGYYLEVALRGCGAGRYYGVVQVGRPAKEYGSFPVDYFASRVMLDKHVTLFDDFRQLESAHYEIGMLDASQCGRLVTIEGLHLTSDSHPDAWKVNLDGEWLGYNFFEDAEGHTIVVYTSEYASYGEHAIPLGELSITGILQRGTIDGEECFMLKMRYEEDCKSIS